uniref:Tc1-like transposase DDE domain-containing protein n=1 Tax=Poecilia mexicana TaxID=48701 RepID=A0A3B3WNJ7_9TELE
MTGFFNRTMLQFTMPWKNSWKEFFQENNITLLDHPACSLDLNPIENIWGWMWMPFVNLLETLASSMPKRLFEVIKKNGGATHY